MLKVTIPANNLKERKYAINVLLGEFLGLPFQLESHPSPETVLTLPNANQLVIPDHFFGHCPNEKSYLSLAYLPNAIQIAGKSSNPFLPEETLPVIFGNELLEITDNRIICGIDVFASLFFMLTRWEEHIKQERDKHGRFPANASLGYKQGFLHRPIVDEMVEMLWKMLIHLGCILPRKHKEFQAIVTHDVDMIRLWNNFPNFVKKLGGDLLVRRDVNEFLFSLESYTMTAFRLRTDPFNTFDYLMDISESNNLRSHFFFMSGGLTPFDNYFEIGSPATKKLIQKIHERGHVIGFHPSYDASLDKFQFEKELKDLQKVSPQPITCGRQHFLRFKVPETWQIWEENGLSWESSMGYPEEPGFRCGTCHAFPVFNVLTRKQLSLRERPLTAMEISYISYKKSSPTEMKGGLMKLLNQVIKYHGDFVLLWHNSSFHGPTFSPYRSIYPQFLEEMTAA